MSKRLYVGNLPYSATEDQLTELFGRAGQVESVRVMRDMTSGRARGFAFVEMATENDARQAVQQLHDYQMEGRALVVNEARPKPEGGGGPGGKPRAPLVEEGRIQNTEFRIQNAETRDRDRGVRAF